MMLRKRIEYFRREIAKALDDGTIVNTRAYYQGKLDGLDWVLLEIADQEKAAELAGEMPLS